MYGDKLIANSKENDLKLIYECAGLYGLKESKWQPCDNDIDKLIIELYSNGPLIVIGLFGSFFYKGRSTLFNHPFGV